MSCRITIRLQPGARRNEIAGSYHTGLRIRVAAPPDKGKANQAMIELLAARLSLSKTSVRIVRGGASRTKVIEIEGLSAEEVIKRLDDAR